jgi:hypothetical protein
VEDSLDPAEAVLKEGRALRAARLMSARFRVVRMRCALAIIIWCAACDSALGPATDIAVPPPAPPKTPVTQPAPFFVSSPVHVLPLAYDGASPAEIARDAAPSVAYVSLPPGAVPNGVVAVIRVERMDSSVSVPLVDGGFDPVAVLAVAGDTISVAVQGAGTGADMSVRFTVPTAKPPIIVRTDPPPHKRDVPLTANMVIVFSAPLDATALSDSTVQLRHDGETVPGQLSFSNAAHTIVQFVPAEPLLANTDYELVVTTGIRDVNGEALADPASVRFTTLVQRLVITTQPLTATAGATLAAVVVTVQDENNKTAMTFTGSVSIAFGSSPQAATLGGATTVSAVAGVATFSTLTVDRPGASYTLVASSRGLPSATSNTFAINVGATARLVFTTQPVSTTAGASLGVVQVSAQDAAGNATPAFAGQVQVTLGANPGAGALGGTQTTTAVAGVATFSDVNISRPGTGYTLVASANALASGTSAPFDIEIGTAESFELISGGGQGASVSTALPQPIVVQVSNAAGIGVPGQTVTFEVTTGGGSVAPANTTTNASGQASSTWTLGPALGIQSVTVRSPGRSALTVMATAGAGPPSVFSLVSGGGQSAVVGAALPQPIVVKVTDAAGNGIAGQTITFAVASGGGSVAPPSTTTDSLGEASTTWTLGVVAGVQSLNAAGIGTGVLVTATAAARVASVLSLVSGGAQSGAASAALPQPIVVKVSDAAGIGVPGQTVTFAVVTGGGSVTPASSMSNAQGLVTTSWMLGPALGAQTMTATAGFTPTVLTITATASAPELPPLSLFTVNPDYGYAEYWEDDALLGIGQYRMAYVTRNSTDVSSPLTVTLSHTGTPRTSVPATVTIPAGDRRSGSFAIAGTSSGIDQLVATAPGHDPATASTVVDKGSLDLILSGRAEYFRVTDSVPAMLCARGYNVALVAATTFALATSANIQFVAGGITSTVITSATIPANETCAVFRAKGVSAGTASVTVTSPNYQTLNTTLEVLPEPRATLTLVSGGGQSATTRMALAQPIVVRVSDDAGNGIAGQTVGFDILYTGRRFATSDGQGLVTMSWTLSAEEGAQTMTVFASGARNELTISATAILNPLQLFVEYNSPSLGIAQRSLAAVRTENNVGSPLTVTLTHTGTARTSVPPNVTIPPGTNLAYVEMVGVSVGTDVLVASAPGYSPVTISTVVDTGVVGLDISGPVKTQDSVQVVLVVQSPFLTTVSVPVSTTFALATNANIRFVSGGVSSREITSAIISPYDNSVRFWIKGVAPGLGSFTMTNANYRTYSATITVTP